MSTVHTTKGIVLRTVKYGDTSVITTVYTELFGIQSYIVKGVRQSGKTSAGKSSYFQPAALLEMEVYHNELKQLQFIREYRWNFLYEKILFDVVRNSIALYIIELLQHSLKQPEANPELFYLIEDSLKQIDRGTDTLVANLPLYFSLQLGSALGFGMQGSYGTGTTVLDLQEGFFLAEKPLHPHYIDGEQAEATSALLQAKAYAELEQIKLNRQSRRSLLQHYQTYLSLHIAGFGELKSFSVLQDILG
ncbi:MAG: DNA repair protein RecO [Chitinophagaceae bacterium]|nr:DNA repair protein RecO [Chitinophagaceae bacterium]